MTIPLTPHLAARLLGLGVATMLVQVAAVSQIQVAGVTPQAAPTSPEVTAGVTSEPTATPASSNPSWTSPSPEALVHTSISLGCGTVVSVASVGDHDEHDHDHDDHDHDDHDHGPLRSLLGLFSGHRHEAGSPVDAALESSEHGVRALWVSVLGLSLTAGFQLVVHPPPAA